MYIYTHCTSQSTADQTTTKTQRSTYTLIPFQYLSSNFATAFTLRIEIHSVSYPPLIVRSLAPYTVWTTDNLAQQPQHHLFANRDCREMFITKNSPRDANIYLTKYAFFFRPKRRKHSAVSFRGKSDRY